MRLRDMFNSVFKRVNAPEDEFRREYYQAFTAALRNIGLSAITLRQKLQAFSLTEQSLGGVYESEINWIIEYSILPQTPKARLVLKSKANNGVDIWDYERVRKPFYRVMDEALAKWIKTGNVMLRDVSPRDNKVAFVLDTVMFEDRDGIMIPVDAEGKEIDYPFIYTTPALSVLWARTLDLLYTFRLLYFLLAHASILRISFVGVEFWDKVPSSDALRILEAIRERIQNAAIDIFGQTQSGSTILTVPGVPRVEEFGDSDWYSKFKEDIAIPACRQALLPIVSSYTGNPDDDAVIISKILRKFYGEIDWSYLEQRGVFVKAPIRQIPLDTKGISSMYMLGVISATTLAETMGFDPEVEKQLLEDEGWSFGTPKGKTFAQSVAK